MTEYSNSQVNWFPLEMCPISMTQTTLQPNQLQPHTNPGSLLCKVYGILTMCTM